MPVLECQMFSPVTKQTSAPIPPELIIKLNIFFITNPPKAVLPPSNTLDFGFVCGETEFVFLLKHFFCLCKKHK